MKFIGFLRIPAPCARRGVRSSALSQTRPASGRCSAKAAWAKVYQQPNTCRTLFDLAEKPVDLGECFRRWRLNHVTTVNHIIGVKRRIGGMKYLRKLLAAELFRELWNLRGGL